MIRLEEAQVLATSWHVKFASVTVGESTGFSALKELVDPILTAGETIGIYKSD